jgi:hypothetical protein
VRFCDPLSQLPHPWDAVSLEVGAHPISPVKPPQAPQVSHAHAVVQERDRACMPELQLPHACVSGSLVAGVQPVSAMQLPQEPHAPQEQLGSQLRLRL